MTESDKRLKPIDVARQLADEHKLGELVGRYRSSYAVPVAVILAGNGAGFFLLLKFMKGGGRLRLNESFVWIVVGFVVSIVYDLGVLFAFRKWITHAFVFEEGLVTVERSGTEVCRWDEIEEVRYTSEEEEGVRHKTYILMLADERQIELSDLTNFRRIARTVRDKTRDRLLAKALAEYNAGHTVHFGESIQVNNEAVVVGETELPWHDLKDVLPPARDGIIYLQRHSGWFKVKAGHVRTIPNHFIFMALLRTLLGQELIAEKETFNPSFLKFALGCFLFVVVTVGLLVAGTALLLGR